jgi:hypothetical protein
VATRISPSRVAPALGAGVVTAGLALLALPA